MYPNKRSIWIMALMATVAVTAACGQAEEAPAPDPAPEEAPAPEPTPEPEPMPEETAPAEPQQPEIVGDIVEVGEGAMDWTSAATRETPAGYWWEVKLRNDTTQTLDITVIWEFLDEQDGNIKTDRQTIQMEPGREGTFRGEGEMNRDDSRAVAGYTYTWEFAIAGS